MDSVLPALLWEAVNDLVRLLVARDFDALDVRGWLGRTTAADLDRVLAEYGRQFVDLQPESREQGCRSFRTRDGSWRIDQNLWSVEEGRSDLTGQLVAWERGAGQFDLSISDLRVL